MTQEHQDAIYQSTYDERDFSRINDPVITWGMEVEIRPDASTGVYLYAERFFAGISAVQLFARDSYLNAYRGERGYFAHGAYKLSVSRLLILEPGGTLKYLLKQIQTDINARMTCRESYRFMLSYHHTWRDLPGQPVTLLIYAGLNNGNFSIAYGYDLGLTSLQKYGYGSHEFRAGYRFCPKRSPCAAYSNSPKRFER